MFYSAIRRIASLLPTTDPARLHQQLDMPGGQNKKTDLAGAPLPPQANTFPDEKAAAPSHVPSTPDKEIVTHDDEHLHEGVYPTEEEKRTLRHIGEPLPKAAFLVAVVELCERFTYYGASGIFQNYVQKPLDGSEGRGALGMGHQGATGLTTFFQFWCYGMLCFERSLFELC
jgi:proton-dependent oligopeptide transporter, POT family